MADDRPPEVREQEGAVIPPFLQSSEGMITGTVVCAAVIATVGGSGHSTGRLEVALIVASFVYWLAHVYAHAIASAVIDRRHPWHAMRHAFKHTWSILGAGLLLVAVLVLADLVGFDPAGAAWVAIDAAILLLAVYGFHAGRRGGLNMTKSIVCGVAGATLGILIALLKAYVLH